MNLSIVKGIIGGLHYMSMVRKLFPSLTILLFTAFLTMVSISSAEDEQTYTYGDYVYQIVEDGKARIVEYIGNDESLEIPNDLNGIIISKLGKGAFGNGIKEIFIPDDVDVEDAAFSNCTTLEEIRISELHKSLMLDGKVLYDKNGTRLIYFPSSLDLKEYRVIDGVTEICDNAFQFNKYINNIVLPVGIKRIGNSAFYFCGHLEKIIIPDTVETIGKLAFTCCGLKEIVLSNRLETIPYKSFSGCTFLKRIVIPEGVKNIEYKAFANLFGIESVVIPDTVTSIDDYAFNKCNKEMVVYCKKGSAAEEYATKKGIKCNYDSFSDTGDTGHTKYNTMGITYALSDYWKHIPVDDLNDIFVLDVHDLMNNAIYISVQDVSVYAQMMDKESNKELLLNSSMSGAMETLKIKEVISESSINEDGKTGLIKMGNSDYGIITMYMEIIDNKLFYLALITDSFPTQYVDEITNCILSIESTNDVNSSVVNKNLENKGVLVQHKLGNLKYSVWNDWYSTETEDKDLGINMIEYYKTYGNPNDGMLFAISLKNAIQNMDDYRSAFKTLLDFCISSLNLNDIDIESKYYMTKNIMGYKATTGENSPISCGIFVTYDDSYGYCFVMVSTNEQITNNEWLETVVNTIEKGD